MQKWRKPTTVSMSWDIYIAKSSNSARTFAPLTRNTNRVHVKMAETSASKDRQYGPPPRASPAADIPEHRIAVNDAGQARLIRGRHEILPKRNIRHVLEGLQLQGAPDTLLRCHIGSGEPVVTQRLDPRTARPPWRRGFAVA